MKESSVICWSQPSGSTYWSETPYENTVTAFVEKKGKEKFWIFDEHLFFSRQAVELIIFSDSVSHSECKNMFIMSVFSDSVGFFVCEITLCDQ